MGHLRAGAHPTLTVFVQCVPFLGEYLKDLKVMDSRMEDDQEVGDLGPDWGDQD